MRTRKLRSRVGAILEGDGVFSQLAAYEKWGSTLESTNRRMQWRVKEVIELAGLSEARDVRVRYFY